MTTGGQNMSYLPSLSTKRFLLRLNHLATNHKHKEVIISGKVSNGILWNWTIYVDFHQLSCCEHYYLKMQAQRMRDAIISHAYVGNLLIKNLCFSAALLNAQENVLQGIVHHRYHHKEKVALSM